jgi:glycosyltransferase involved in cell wall biosynthesis
LILVNLLSAVSGGSVTYLNNIVPRLIKLDTENCFLFLITQSKFDKLVVEYNSNGLCIENFIIVNDKYAGIKRFLLEKKIIQWIKEKSIKKVFTPYQVGKLYKGVQNIFMIRNMEPFLFKKYDYDLKNRVRNHLLNSVSKSTLNKADKVIAVSHYSKDYLFNDLKLEEGKVKTIYHGRDVSFTHVENNDKDFEILKSLNLESRSYLFTAGSLLPYRRLEDILEAFSKINKGTTLRLVVAGDGNDNKYKRLINQTIQKHNLESSVILVGHVDKSCIQCLYRHSLIFIAATEIEACPNIAIESLSSGCSILSSYTEPLKEIYKDGAVYFNKRDPKMLSQKMDSLLKDEKTRKTISQKALINAAFFSWDKCAEETYKFLITN